jgi:phage terminase large subunit GpA-like protein
VRIVGIGTNCAKAEIFDLLRHALPTADESPSPGCYHFPLCDMVYFEGLTAEAKIVKPNGDVVYEKRGPRNEPVYNRVAASVVGIDCMGEEHRRRFEHAVQINGPPVPPRTPPPGNSAAGSPGSAGGHIQPGRPTGGGFRRF